MIVDKYSVFRFKLSLRGPVRVRPDLVIGDRYGVLIRVESDERAVGWGEASPLPGFSSESLDDVVQNVDAAMSRIAGKDVTSELMDQLADEDDIWRRLHSLDFAIAGAIDALHFRQMRRGDGRSVGADGRSLLPVARLVQGTSVEVAIRAGEAAAAGYSCVKLKVGRADLDRDVAMVEAVREAVGSGVAIRLDANRAWSLSDAASFCDRVLNADIEFLEEPLATPSDIREFAEDSSIPVAIDESIVDNPSLIDNGIVAAAVLKPTILGSTATRRLVERCRAAGVQSIFSCSYESAVGTFAVARMAASSSDRLVAAGLGTHAFLNEDVTRTRVSFDSPLVDVGSVFADAMNVDTSILSPL